MLDGVQNSQSQIPQFEGDPLTDPVEGMETPSQDLSENRLEILWEQIKHAGLTDVATRYATHGLLVMMVLILIWAIQAMYLDNPASEDAPRAFSAFAAPLPTPTPTMPSPVLPDYAIATGDSKIEIRRNIEPYTIIPSRPRVGVITYTVQTGDSVFGIAERFGLKPETILWGNYNVLADNPHRLQPDQVLTILPIDGTYHKWSAGENLQKVADFYRVDAWDIVEWPGNPFDIYATNIANPGIVAGTMLIVPGGQRDMIDYGPPLIPRDNPAVARTYGPGHCGEVTDGAIGDGSFIWPAIERHLTGYDYSPGTNHWGIDIDGDLGTGIWSIDHGVVVYSGWSYNGYGNLVVVDHGNGWQSLYAHLNDIYVGCGESVYQGTILGALGSTGNSSGPHLHFELIYGSAKVNPWDFLQ